jgi:hypothetical protein
MRDVPCSILPAFARFDPEPDRTWISSFFAFCCSAALIWLNRALTRRTPQPDCAW